MSLGTEFGLVIIPRSGGLDPRCTSELKMAKFSLSSPEIVPIRLAGLYPVILLIKFNLEILSRLSMSSLVKQFTVLNFQC